MKYHKIPYVLATMMIFAIGPTTQAFVSRSPFHRNKYPQGLSDKSATVNSGRNYRLNKNTFLKSGEINDLSAEPILSARRITYTVLWSGLLLYANYFSSSVGEQATAISTEIINKAIFSPFDGTLSPVFVALFNFLGILPAVYAGLLLPSANRQKIWAIPFISSSFAFGFFGLGPYLCLRNRPLPIFGQKGQSPSNIERLTVADRCKGSILFDTKITAALLLAGTAYLIYYGIFGNYLGADRWVDFLHLYNTQPIARISTLDFIILSLAVRDYPYFY